MRSSNARLRSGRLARVADRRGRPSAPLRLSPAGPERPAKETRAAWVKAMRAKMELEGNRTLYRLRKQTVEPVFGVVKGAMGFRQFRLRGLRKVEGEWALVLLANNCKRMNSLL